MDTNGNSKELLIKDLCSRLPYGVYVDAYSWQKDSPKLLVECVPEYVGEEIVVKGLAGRHSIKEIKPYLRPMSSMTEEEKKELKSATCPEGTGYFDEQYLICPMSHFGEHISYDFMSDILNWLNAHHFDVRNLIGRGLAIDCTNLNIY